MTDHQTYMKLLQMEEKLETIIYAVAKIAEKTKALDEPENKETKTENEEPEVPKYEPKRTFIRKKE